MITIDLNNLPSETCVLHRIIGDLVVKNSDLLTENEYLKEQLALLKAKRFGKSSEKLDKQIDELELRIEENESFSKVPADTKEDKQVPKRKKLPDHLSRIDILLNPDPKCPSCGGEEFRKINDDISETLEYVPSSFKVLRYIRPRCACINCEKIVQAYPPSKAIDKGKAGSGLLAHILVQKYCNHLPLFRQSQIYAREDVDISRSTMSGWVGQCFRLLEPLIDELRKSVFSSSQIHGDDTPIKVLAPGTGKTKTGRIWVYVRDGRPHGDKVPPAVCYYYSPDRKGARPAEHLKGYTGVLHADAYAGYDGLYSSTKKPEATITEAACWAHMRRKFYEITAVNDKANIAIAAVEQIAKIYKIEEQIKGLAPDKRLRYRQEHSKELVQKLFADLKKAYSQLPQKSSTAKAIAYAMNNQTALMRFLDNGKIEIDNNTSERALRSVAIGRKNWLFAGTDDGGHAAAAMYSLIETAKINDKDPYKYLKRVLDIIQDYNSAKIADLLPWNLEYENSS